jgi:F0F1-type ATP synthase membrane subunit a
MRLTKNVRGGLIVMIIFAIAALNLIFLLSELTMNVVKVYFG